MKRFAIALLLISSPAFSADWQFEQRDSIDGGICLLSAWIDNSSPMITLEYGEGTITGYVDGQDIVNSKLLVQSGIPGVVGQIQLRPFEWSVIPGETATFGMDQVTVSALGKSESVQVADRNGVVYAQFDLTGSARQFADFNACVSSYLD